MIIVRKATIEDEAKVYDLMELLIGSSGGGDFTLDRQTSAVLFREIVNNNKNGSILLAEEDGEAMGLVTLSYPVAIHCQGVYSCIEEFIVREQARGKGVGGQLLQAAFAEATEKGCYGIQVNGPSELGYPAYIKQGFQDIGRHLHMKLPPQAHGFFSSEGYHQGQGFFPKNQ